MSKANGRPETRIVYGASCTWWGPIQDAHTPTKNLHYRDLEGKAKQGHELEPYIPVCPSCYGPLMQVPTEEDFFIAVHNYQNGFGTGRKRIRKHPGYVEFMKWLEHRCFPSVIKAATAYKEQTGLEITFDPKEFQ